MFSVEILSGLLEALYSAPLDQKQWQVFLTLLCEYTGSNNGYFFRGDSHRGHSMRAVGGEPGGEFSASYNSGYAGVDPYRAPVIRNGTVGAFRAEELVPDEVLLGSEIYRDLLAPRGLRYGALMPLNVSLRLFEVISVWRSGEAGPLDDETYRILNLLVPHIRKALEIDRALGVTRRDLAGAEMMADASATGVFLLKRSGQVVHSNAAADELVRTSGALKVERQVLAPVDQRARAALERALGSLAVDPSLAGSNGSAQHAILLPREGCGQALQMLIAPLSAAQRGRTHADALVLVSDPERPVRFPDETLRGLYELTHAEVEIANGLLMGYSLTEIASLRGVSIGTVRHQIKAILGKTSTTRQSELIQLLMALPQIPAQSSEN